MRALRQKQSVLRSEICSHVLGKPGPNNNQLAFPDKVHALVIDIAADFEFPMSSDRSIGVVTDDEKEASATPYPAAAIKLLLLTGCRRSEITNLRLEHVDFEHQCLRLPDSKTGAKIVYVNAPAMAVLQKLPRVENNPYAIDR